MAKKTTCVYCGGETVDDSRGNCAACGAPRDRMSDLETAKRHIQEAHQEFGRFAATLKQAGEKLGKAGA